MRCRLVLQETKRSWTINSHSDPGAGAVFASTPPLGWPRTIASVVISGLLEKRHLLRFLGVRRAHLQCEIRHTAYISMPPEHPCCGEKGCAASEEMASIYRIVFGKDSIGFISSTHVPRAFTSGDAEFSAWNAA